MYSLQLEQYDVFANGRIKIRSKSLLGEIMLSIGEYSVLFIVT